MWSPAVTLPSSWSLAWRGMWKTGCMVSMVWVNPNQARVPTVEEAVKQLTALVSRGPNWPYALVQLNGDTCHAPLPRERHLGILPEGNTSRTTCRMVRQLEVCQLLHLNSQVIYPVGMNGCKIPLITPLSESLANGINLPGGELINLKVDILQSIMEEPEWKALPPGNCPSILMVSPIKATLSKAEREVSMTMEVRELLTRVVLDMSGHVSEILTPKRLNPVVILTPLAHELGDPYGPWMMLRWWKPPWRKSPLSPLLQLRHQGTAAVLLPQMQAIYEKRPTRP